MEKVLKTVSDKLTPQTTDEPMSFYHNLDDSHLNITSSAKISTKEILRHIAYGTVHNDKTKHYFIQYP